MEKQLEYLIMTEGRKRIAVIGAGPSGLSSLYALREYHGKEMELVCFERHPEIGGLWYYTDETGIDKYGIPIHCSMYKDLWINQPKEFFEFPQYHYPENIPSFGHRDIVFDYPKSFAEKFDLNKFVRFETYVEKVAYNSDTEKFSLTSKHLPSQEGNIELFDNIIVCTGHFSTPNVPDFPGMKSFPGEVIHSHDFREATKYAGKQILIVGGGFSGEDIALQCFKYRAKHVTISYRTKATGLNWPESIEERPLLTSVRGRKLEFSDGSNDEYDAIILCTGYLHSFTFLEENLRLITTNRLVPPLFKQIVFPDNPKVFYIGMQNQAYTFPMFHLQALFSRDVLLGKIRLPDKSEMLKEIKELQQEESKVESLESFIRFQTNIVEDLAKITKSQSVNALNGYLEEHLPRRDKNVITYRNYQHHSIHTGKLAPPGPEWLTTLKTC